MVAYSHDSGYFIDGAVSNLFRIFPPGSNCLSALLRIMRMIWQKWKIVAGKIGDFQATVLFSLLYFLLVTPLGLISSIFNDFLNTKDLPQWKKMIKNTSSRQEMGNQ